MRCVKIALVLSLACVLATGCSQGREAEGQQGQEDATDRLSTGSDEPRGHSVSSDESHGTETGGLPGTTSGQTLTILDEFRQDPSEAVFGWLAQAGKEDPQYRIFYYYDQHSRMMTPSDDWKLDVPEEDIVATLTSCDETEWAAFAEVMLLHPDRWRRWTMAKTIGSYGPYSCKESLERLLREHVQPPRQGPGATIEDILKGALAT